jgi:cleavage stimulation factor subunit 2
MSFFSGPVAASHSHTPSHLSSNDGSNKKNDVFVGNLAFDTTEQHLLAAFADVGAISSCKVMVDGEGKSRGFAFVEFYDAQHALAAIRNMNGIELNGRTLRCNFSNNSYLEGLAGQLGLDMTRDSNNAAANMAKSQATGKPLRQGDRSNINLQDTLSVDRVAEAISNLTKAEMYTILQQLKSMAAADPQEARNMLTSHPQMPEALLHIMSKMEMIKTPLPRLMQAATGTLPASAVNGAGSGNNPGNNTSAMPPMSKHPPPPQFNQPPPQFNQPPPQFSHAPPPMFAPPPPPANYNPNTGPPPMQQMQQMHDPRRSDPRMHPPPPPPGQGPPGPPPGAPPGAVADISTLNPALVQQVMSLSDQQIRELPPDHQATIVQMRAAIIANGGR